MDYSDILSELQAKVADLQVDIARQGGRRDAFLEDVAKCDMTIAADQELMNQYLSVITILENQQT